MTELATAWTLGCVCGFFMGVTVAANQRPRHRESDWRRSFNHENTNRPSGDSPFIYRPRSHGMPIIPPPRNP